MQTIKRIAGAVTLVLALNFLALAGGAFYLHSSAGLDAEKLSALREVLWPTPEVEPVELEDVEPEPPSAVDRIEEILAAQDDLPAGQRSEAVTKALAGQADELDRRLREIHDLKQQLLLATRSLADDRRAVADDQEQLAERQAEAQTLAEDEGFKQTLDLYAGLPPKQVKDLFLTLDRDTVVRYLSAMNTRKANKILKEFKRPDEQRFIRGVLEDMRRAENEDAPQTATRAPAGSAT